MRPLKKQTKRLENRRAHLQMCRDLAAKRNSKVPVALAYKMPGSMNPKKK